jgi:hypothetical protein
MAGNQGNLPSKPKHAGGRPSDYTKEKGDLICERISTHDVGLPRLCKMYSDMPDEKTVQRWRYQNAEFRLKYAQAKMIQADLLAEQCLEISDSCIPEEVGVDRLRVDTRKWLASKLLPKQYGDKLLLEQKTEENEQLKEELRALRARLDESNKREF